MFIVAKSFTNKRGEMFLKIFPNQYPSIETAHAAMQTDYQEELKKRHLDRSDEETIPSSYYIDTTEAAILVTSLAYAQNTTTLCIRIPNGKRSLPKRKPDSTKNTVL